MPVFNYRFYLPDNKHSVFPDCHHCVSLTKVIFKLLLGIL